MLRMSREYLPGSREASTAYLEPGRRTWGTVLRRGSQEGLTASRLARQKIRRSDRSKVGGSGSSSPGRGCNRRLQVRQERRSIHDNDRLLKISAVRLSHIHNRMAIRRLERREVPLRLDWYWD